MKTLWLDHFVRDCKASLKSMSNYPVACAVAVLSLAFGIGCTTATLTLRNALFYNPPPLYRDPAQLSFAGVNSAERRLRQDVSPQLFQKWSVDRSLFSGIAATTARVRQLGTANNMQAIAVRSVTPSLFSVLGVAPAAGRVFAEGEQKAAILSYPTWDRVFFKDAGIVGKEVWLDDEPYTVVGVMPQRFWYADLEPTIWVPLDVQRLDSAERVDVVMRRNAGVTAAMLQQSLHQQVEESNTRAVVEAVAGTPIGRQVGPGVVWLLGACVFFTLLISCTNVAVLMIAQWTAREREIAIRSSLGASRGRVIRLLLTESSLLAIFGGAFGICATFALKGLMTSRGDMFQQFNTDIDARILLQAMSITLATGIVAGLAPALYETRRLQANPLRLIPSDRVRQFWRNTLVSVEIMVTVALLGVTGMMVDSYWRALAWDIWGFDARRLVLAEVENPAGVRLAELRAALAPLSGTTGASAASSLPMYGPPPSRRVALDAAGSNASMAHRVFVDAGFFRTLQVPMRRGRTFSPQEESSAASRVVVVNEVLAQRMWPGKEALGASLFVDNVAHEVIGVTGDITWTALLPASADFFLPYSQQPPAARRAQFVIRNDDPTALLNPARTALRNSDRGGRISVQTSQSILDQIAWEILSVVYPMTPLIGTGILLTTAGIYSVLAFAITRRQKELAIRMAIGATRRDLLRLVAGLTVRLVGTGVVLGTAAMYWLSRVAQGQGGPFDSNRPWVFVLPFGLVLLIGVLATAVPSRRATSIDPATLLRND